LYVSLWDGTASAAIRAIEPGQQAALGGDDRIQARAVAVEHRRRLAQFVEAVAQRVPSAPVNGMPAWRRISSKVAVRCEHER
jgi:hypothetical protein